jgi:small subunit ribosomal protein S20
MAKDTKNAKKEKIPTPIKRNKQNEKQRLINKSFRSTVRTALNEFEAAVKGNDRAVINEKLSLVYSLMDKGVKKGIYKINKASRTKARLTAHAAAAKA